MSNIREFKILQFNKNEIDAKLYTASGSRIAIFDFKIKDYYKLQKEFDRYKPTLKMVHLLCRLILWIHWIKQVKISRGNRF